MYKQLVKLTLFLSLYLLVDTNYAQSKIFLNPGLKFGYAFSGNKDFTLGAELSIVYWHSDRAPFYYGAVISAEVGKNIFIYHFGIETGMAFGGVEIGPSFIKRNGVKNFGYGLTAYTGFIIMPFYSFTKVRDGDSISQVGSFIKFPILAKGRPFYSN